MSMPPPPPPSPGNQPPPWQPGPPPPPGSVAQPGSGPQPGSLPQPGHPGWPGQPAYPQQPYQQGPPMETASSPLAWIALAGAALCIVATFLVWITLHGDSESLELKGLDEDPFGDRVGGVLTLPMAIIAAVMLILGATLRRRVFHILAAVAAGLAALFGLGQMGNVDDFNDLFGDGSAEVGPGLWLTVLGATLSMICAIIAAVQTKRRPVPYGR